MMTCACDTRTHSYTHITSIYYIPIFSLLPQLRLWVVTKKKRQERGTPAWRKPPRGPKGGKALALFFYLYAASFYLYL
jgi:hypothetical protein